MIEKADFNVGKVGVKSFNWKYSKGSLEFFLNEIVTFEIIQGKNRDSSLSEAKETLKCQYIAEYVGFIVNDYADPFYGSIVTKWYPMGDLSTFTRRISNPKWFAKTEESTNETTKESTKESTQESTKESTKEESTKEELTKEESNSDKALADQKRENMPKEITTLVELARQIAEGVILILEESKIIQVIFLFFSLIRRAIFAS